MLDVIPERFRLIYTLFDKLYVGLLSLYMTKKGEQEHHM